MFNQLFSRASTAEFHFAGPLAEERVRFLNHCAEQGAARPTLRRTAQYLLVIISQLDLHVDGEVSVEEIEEAAHRWAFRQPRHHKMKDGRRTERHFVFVATQWLRFLGRLHEDKVPSLPYAHLVAEFAAYMEHEKGLSLQTIKTECFYVTDFLGRFCAPPRRLREIPVAELDEAIALKGTQDHYARGSLRFYASALRAFFRYAEMQGWCKVGLAASILAPRLYRQELLPVGPSWDDVQRLLAATRGASPSEIRDRAVLLLLIIYGLRSAEVRGLRLDDFNWEQDLLSVTRPKPRKKQVYPLAESVGEAILRYLKEVRPRSRYREVFLTLQAPIQPLSAPGLWHVVGRRLRALGVSLRRSGPHSLRHACATHLLAQDFSMKEIGDHLGHRSPESTRVYAKVDLSSLRRVADFDLGGLA